MTIPDAVLAFAGVAGLLTLVPGLDTTLVLRSSLTRTRPHAWATALGVVTGAMVWGVAAAVGVSALLTASGTAYRVLTVAGAGYVLWLGASLIRRSFRGSAGHAAGRSGAAQGTPPMPGRRMRVPRRGRGGRWGSAPTCSPPRSGCSTSPRSRSSFPPGPHRC